MKKSLKIFKLSLMLLVLSIFATNMLWANPDVVAQLRLYQGFKVDAAAPAKVITSYYLKPITGKDVFLELDISKEKASLKKVFNLKDIEIVTQAGILLKEDSVKSPFRVVVLNGRRLLLQLSTIEGKKNRFRVEVLETGEKSRSLLESKIYLPQEKTTVLGFEDSEGKIYFLSFHRGTDTSYSGKPIDIKSIRKPSLIKSPQPKYPKAALKAHIDGKVVINATTDVKGQVVEAEVVSGPDELTGAARDAVIQWVYHPYIVNGEAKAVKFTVVIKFNLDKKKKAEKPTHVSSEQKPKLLKKVNPAYPKLALKAHIEGKVVIEAVTDTKGRVVEAKIVDGPPALRKASLEAIKQWEYEPYVIDGVKKPVSFTVIMDFKLHKKDKQKKAFKKPLNLSSDQKPKLVKKVNPKYPKDALKAHVDGTVVIEAVTDKKGIVVEAKVVEGHPLLNKAALEALRQWKYEPYIINGEAQPVSFTVVMKFNLDKKKKKD